MQTTRARTNTHYLFLVTLCLLIQNIVSSLSGQKYDWEKSTSVEAERIRVLINGQPYTDQVGEPVHDETTEEQNQIVVYVDGHKCKHQKPRRRKSCGNCISRQIDTQQNTVLILK